MGFLLKLLPFGLSLLKLIPWIRDWNLRRQIKKEVAVEERNRNLEQAVEDAEAAHKIDEDVKRSSDADLDERLRKFSRKSPGS